MRRTEYKNRQGEVYRTEFEEHNEGMYQMVYENVSSRDEDSDDNYNIQEYMDSDDDN